MSKVQVAVRVRPFNRREQEAGLADLIVRMQGTQTILDGRKTKDGEDKVRSALGAVGRLRKKKKKRKKKGGTREGERCLCG